MRSLSRLSLVIHFSVVMLLLLAFVACGDGDGTSDPAPTDETDSTPAASRTPAGNESPKPDPNDRTQASGSITVYSGRAEALIGPIIVRFEQDTGIEVRVRYAGTPELAATIIEEGRRSPADVYIAQDAGSLGLLSKEGFLSALPQDILDRVTRSYRAENGAWVGLSGRARVVAYNVDQVDPATLPSSILGYAEPEWCCGRIGWAPTNGSFQAFVTALRVVHGEDAAREWLEGVKANQPREYPNNTTTVRAVATGEAEVGFVNHYYLVRFLAEEGEGFGARNSYFDNGDIGGLMNVAGAAILNSARNPLAAERFIEYLLQETAQEFFATETFEFPLVANVKVSFNIPTLHELQPVAIDLTNLDDLRGTIELLQETGVLP
jgi:iron(III) transport system substrate-binding protein